MAKDGGTIYFIAGLLMGGLVGAGMGMLMAPDDKKRAEMIKTGGEILDNSMQHFKKFQEKKIRPAFEKVRDSVEHFDPEDFEKKVMSTVEKIQSKVEQKPKTVKRTVKAK